MPSLKAPKGGMVSMVNDQWYNGGEFAPDTGIYCGRGKNRVSQAQFSEVFDKAQKVGYILRYSETYDRFEITKTVRLSDGGTTDQMFFNARNLSTLERLIK